METRSSRLFRVRRAPCEKSTCKDITAPKPARRGTELTHAVLDVKTVQRIKRMQRAGMKLKAIVEALELEHIKPRTIQGVLRGDTWRCVTE